MLKIEKDNSIYLKFFFKFDIYLFSTGTVTTNKLDDSTGVVHF